MYILIFGGTHMDLAEQTGFKKRLLASLEAAEYLGISHSYLRQLRSDGHIGRRVSPPPHIRVGKIGLRYDIRDLDRWIEDQPRYQTYAEVPTEDFQR